MIRADVAPDLRRGRRGATPDADTGGAEEINSGHLRAFIERIERIREEQKSLGEDLKEIYAEAKGNGFDPRIIKDVVKIRAQDAEKRVEHETILDLYLAALGMAN